MRDTVLAILSDRMKAGIKLTSEEHELFDLLTRIDNDNCLENLFEVKSDLRILFYQLARL